MHMQQTKSNLPTRLGDELQSSKLIARSRAVHILRSHQDQIYKEVNKA